VAADDVETGIGPVLMLEETKVRWTFMDLLWLELGTEKEEVKGGGGCSVGHGLNEEGEKLAFHGISGGDGFDKIEAPIFRFVGLRRSVSENTDGSLDVVPIDVPLIGLEPMGGCFDVGDFDRWA